MLQIAQNYKNGELALLEVPVPACKPGGVLVRSHFSLVSTGTELMKIDESRLSLIGKARARPDQVRKVLATVSQQGVGETYRKVTNRLDSYTPLGYSLCGEVIEVGAGVDEFRLGQRVACAGNLHALHAEYNWVPRNLCVAVPDAVSSEQAAFATVGAIAMHGYRQSEAQLGESAVIIGLGLVGQLLLQILRAAGVNVVGVDPSPERRALAEAMGAAACATPDAMNGLQSRLSTLTSGAGADHIFLTASGDTSQPVQLAAELARDRARVVDIGKCRLDLPWNDYYAKELDVRFSRSYGPGRYDPTYEEAGVDYPIGYVRWTERRNLGCFLDLVAAGRVDLEALTSAVVPFEEAVDAYERLRSGDLDGIGLLFRYEPRSAPKRRITAGTPAKPRAPSRPGIVRLGVIGAGNYAGAMLLPHLHDDSDVELVEVATSTALSSVNAQRKFGFERASTDTDGLLADESIEAVLIVTRHDSHARFVCEALHAGKAVFVEKPLALTSEQLAAISTVVDETGNDRVMVGFNRRFAPLLVDLKSRWGPQLGPLQLHYTVNAGSLEAGSWYARIEEQGARFVAEGCHFIDTASWWLDSDPVDAFAISSSQDSHDVVCTLRYEDGSVVTISYLTGGEPRYPKETLHVFGQSQVAVLRNFQQSELWRGGRRRESHGLRNRRGKGQRQELSAFVAAVRDGNPMPIPFHSLVATTQATFAARRSLFTQRLEPLFSDADHSLTLGPGGNGAGK